MDDISAFVAVLGLSNPDVVWTFATIPWESQDDRNAFIAEIGNMSGSVGA